jgi:hypothetical protein
VLSLFSAIYEGKSGDAVVVDEGSDRKGEAKLYDFWQMGSEAWRRRGRHSRVDCSSAAIK